MTTHDRETILAVMLIEVACSKRELRLWDQPHLVMAPARYGELIPVRCAENVQISPGPPTDSTERNSGV